MSSSYKVILLLQVALLGATGCYRLLAQPVVIKVDAGSNLGRIRPEVYGANHRWFRNGISMWDSVHQRVHPKFVEVYRDLGFKSLRYPAGTLGNLFFWKRSIGPVHLRENVINGKVWSEQGAGPLTTTFGLDEMARFCEENNTLLVYMYNCGNGSTADAADLVEYLNAPVGSNPNGGVAWAGVRAQNGHPAPYRVKHFEIGNEMYLKGQQKYWMEGKSKHSHEYKYCFGDTVAFTRQAVGQYDNWQEAAALSNYTPYQVKYVKYPPVVPGSDTLYVHQTPWKRVKNLQDHGPENVYTLDEATGIITFGDGVHGNLPLHGDSPARITVSYLTFHEGFDGYYKAMKAVDPEIKVYSCLHDNNFIRTMGQSPYDGVAMHPYAGRWNIPKNLSVPDFHDAILYNSDHESDSIFRTREVMRKTAAPQRARDMEVIVTEYGIVVDVPSPNYHKSLDQALYGARILMACIEAGMPLAQKHTLIDGGGHGLINTAPDFTVTAPGYVYKLFTRMFGPTRIASGIQNSPRRQMFNGRYLEKLKVTASKDDAGNVYIIVINRDREDAVQTKLQLAHCKISAKTADVWTLNGPSYTAYNTPENPTTVSIKETTHPVKNSFAYTFPPHSVTAIKIKGSVANKAVSLAP